MVVVLLVVGLSSLEVEVSCLEEDQVDPAAVNLVVEVDPVVHHVLGDHLGHQKVVALILEVVRVAAAFLKQYSEYAWFK